MVTEANFGCESWVPRRALQLQVTHGGEDGTWGGVRWGRLGLLLLGRSHVSGRIRLVLLMLGVVRALLLPSPNVGVGVGVRIRVPFPPLVVLGLPLRQGRRALVS